MAYLQNFLFLQNIWLMHAFFFFIKNLAHCIASFRTQFLKSKRNKITYFCKLSIPFSINVGFVFHCLFQVLNSGTTRYFKTKFFIRINRNTVHYFASACIFFCHHCSQYNLKTCNSYTFIKVTNFYSTEKTGR